MTEPDTTEYVWVRRQWNDARRLGKVPLSALRKPRWDVLSGGLNHWTPQPFIHAYMMCDSVVEGRIGHSCRHGPPPHEVKVCVTRKGNNSRVFARLLEMVGPKPRNSRRPQRRLRVTPLAGPPPRAGRPPR